MTLESQNSNKTFNENNIFQGNLIISNFSNVDSQPDEEV